MAPNYFCGTCGGPIAPNPDTDSTWVHVNVAAFLTSTPHPARPGPTKVEYPAPPQPTYPITAWQQALTVLYAAYPRDLVDRLLEPDAIYMANVIAKAVDNAKSQEP